MGIKNKQTIVRKTKATSTVKSNETVKPLKEMPLQRRQEIFGKTLQARRESLGALKAQLANYQKAVGSLLEIDDALLNMLGQDNPLTK